MVGDHVLAPPATYATGWLVLGVAALAVAFLLPLAVVLLTGPWRWRRPGRRSTRLRRAYLARIDAIAADHAAGVLDVPAATSALSAALRRFASEWTGTLYPAMTLHQLDDHAPGTPLRSRVADLYPPTFARHDADVADAAAAAREVVRSWRPS